GGGRTDGVLAEGTITAANVIARPDSAACPGGLATFDDLVARLRSGDAYVNVHTDDGAAPPNTGAGDFPGGHIRGQARSAPRGSGCRWRSSADGPVPSSQLGDPEDSSQFRPGPPDAVTSKKYAADFDEVKSLGGDGVATPSRRTAEQTQIALFWYESS